MRLDLSFAGLRLSFYSDPSQSQLTAPPQYAPFMLAESEGIPNAVYRISPLVDAPTQPESPRWEADRLRFFRREGRHLVAVQDAVTRQWQTRAEISDSFQEGTIYQPDTGIGRPDLHAFDTPLDRVILAGLLASLGGIMAHGCSIADGNAGLLFTGPSGSGKTTAARLWEASGAQCLNDERSILMPDGDGAVIGATPWHGEHPRIHAAVPPLAAIFHLVKSGSNAIRALPPADALSRLMTLTFIPVFRDDGLALALSACAAMVERVPSFEFQFTPDGRAVECCREWMEKGRAISPQPFPPR